MHSTIPKLVKAKADTQLMRGQLLGQNPPVVFADLFSKPAIRLTKIVATVPNLPDTQRLNQVTEIVANESFKLKMQCASSRPN